MPNDPTHLLRSLSLIRATVTSPLLDSLDPVDLLMLVPFTSTINTVLKIAFIIFPSGYVILSLQDNGLN